MYVKENVCTASIWLDETKSICLELAGVANHTSLHYLPFSQSSA
jgi:hypothetical protein